MITATATPAERFRLRYRMETADKGDCIAFRRNTLRYCFNHEDELLATAESLRQRSMITGIDYACKVAFSNARREKYREMLRKYLTADQMKELILELPEYREA